MMDLFDRSQTYEATALIGGEERTYTVDGTTTSDVAAEIAEKAYSRISGRGVRGKVRIASDDGEGCFYGFSVKYNLPSGSHAAGKERSIWQVDEEAWEEARREWEKENLFDV